MDYETLRIIWWVLIGVVLIGFAILDGFDFGSLVLLLLVAKTDIERRVVINTIGPIWESNQVWFILAGGALFAAWPYLYAVSFSGFYIPMFLLLLAFIVRPVALKYRSKANSRFWRSSWDGLLTGSAFGAIFLFGLMMGNIFQGTPFYFDIELRPFYKGSFITWNTFSILCALTSIFLLVLQGAAYLCIKTTQAVQTRAAKLGRYLVVFSIFLLLMDIWWVKFYVIGYRLISQINVNGFSTPIHKIVLPVLGAWTNNFSIYKFGYWLLASIFFGLLLAFSTFRSFPKIAFLGSSLSIAAVISTVGFAMFPFLLPSSSNPNHSLLIWDASASPTALKIMSFFTAIFFPIVIAYIIWVYRILRGKVTAATVIKNQHQVY